MAGVILERVSRVYPGGVAAVREISLEVLDREFLVLVGPSGCGKTTTLRLIAGLEELSGGTIQIGPRVVNDVPPKDRDIAMVFQNYALYPHMNVYRNMAFGLELREGLGGWRRMLGWALPAARRAELAARRFAIAQRVHDAARTLGIEKLLDRLPGQLSGGQRQRVALGRAIVRNPAVFLFDEPLSNLDAKLRVEMRRELKELHRRLAATMVYVTHDQVEALTLGDRIVVMDGGTIQQIGSPMEVYDWPANRFVASFIGTPAMNLIDGQLEQHAGQWRFRHGKWSVPLSERTLDLTQEQPTAVTLGVRPEDVRLAAAGETEAAEAVVRSVEMLGDATVMTAELTTAELLTTPSGKGLGGTGQEKSGTGRGVEGLHERQHKNEASYVALKIDPRGSQRVGDRVRLQIDARRVHLFDARSTRNLVRPQAS